ncbi:MAG: YjgN family protein [Pseudomonadota bacterium]
MELRVKEDLPDDVFIEKSQANNDFSPDEIPFEFTGKAGEYFKIWIVNIFLTILTLGVYSAWAKVRNKRYFYGSTWLNGSSFEYLATGMTIFRGRIIAAVIFGGYVLTGYISPTVQLYMMPVLLILTPWIIIRSLRFNALNSAWCNIRFNYHGSYFNAAVAYVFLPLILGFSLGLLYPVYMYYRQRLVTHFHAYGTARSSLEASIGSFYLSYLKAVLLLAGMLVTIWFIGPFIGLDALYVSFFENIGPMLSDDAGEMEQQMAAGAITLLIASIVVPFYFFLSVYLTVTITNLVYNNISVADNHFRSTLRYGEMLWIYFSNIVVVILSLGLMTPWAKIRVARYRAEHLVLLPADNLESFVAETEKDTQAAGQELGEFFDLDVGM